MVNNVILVDLGKQLHAYCIRRELFISGLVNQVSAYRNTREIKGQFNSFLLVKLKVGVSKHHREEFSEDVQSLESHWQTMRQYAFYVSQEIQPFLRQDNKSLSTATNSKQIQTLISYKFMTARKYWILC